MDLILVVLERWIIGSSNNGDLRHKCLGFKVYYDPDTP